MKRQILGCTHHLIVHCFKSQDSTCHTISLVKLWKSNMFWLSYLPQWVANPLEQTAHSNDVTFCVSLCFTDTSLYPPHSSLSDPSIPQWINSSTVSIWNPTHPLCIHCHASPRAAPSPRRFRSPDPCHRHIICLHSEKPNHRPLSAFPVAPPRAVLSSLTPNGNHSSSAGFESPVA